MTLKRRIIEVVADSLLADIMRSIADILAVEKEDPVISFNTLNKLKNAIRNDLLVGLGECL